MSTLGTMSEKVKILNGYRNSLSYNESIHPEISAICSPLNDIGVEYFYYVKVFKNGRRLYITNRHEFLKYVLDNDLILPQSQLLQKELLKVSKTDFNSFIWTGVPKDEVHEVLYHLDIWNGITFYYNRNDFIEIFGFGAKRENDEKINFYIQNVDLLEKFISYFTCKAQEHINTTDSSHLLANEKKPLFCKIGEEGMNTQDFLNKIKADKYYLRNGAVITRREAECLLHLSKGRTVKDIARELDISHRTVESYIINVKRKTDIVRKSELAHIFLNSHIKI